MKLPLINPLRKTGQGQLQLQTIDRLYPMLFKIMWILIMIAGVMCTAGVFMLILFSHFFWPGFQVTHMDRWFFTGFILLISAQFFGIIHKILKTVHITYWFDAHRREIRIKPGDESYYEFLPKVISFDEVRTLRLRRAAKSPKNVFWLFEVCLTGDRFFPVTAFMDERKARKMLQEIQQVLPFSLEEGVLEQYDFRSYKNSFIQQFQHSELSD